MSYFLSALENSMEDFWVTVERTREAAKWKEDVVNEWLDKGQAVFGDMLKKATEAIRRAEEREGKEVRVRLMETNRDELINLADRVEKQAADETEPGPLIELGEKIEYRRDNVASIARMLKGDIHEELKERAQRASDESVEAAKAGQQRLDTFRARLEFHSFNSEAGRSVYIYLGGCAHTRHEKQPVQ